MVKMVLLSFPLILYNTENNMNEIKDILNDFDEWAAQMSREDQSPEWESEYPGWMNAYSMFELWLKNHALTAIDLETKRDILKLLAHDSEDGVILGLLEDYPEIGDQVAISYSDCSDPNARWQISQYLGTRDSPETISLLETLLEDTDNYVRRIALLSLAKRDLLLATSRARNFLMSNDEYLRLIAITILGDAKPSDLETILHTMRNDPSDIVRERVRSLLLDLEAGFKSGGS